MKSYGKISLYATTLVLPVPVFVGAVLGYVLKSANPDKVDITNGLAYLAPILITSFVVLAVIWGVALIAGLLGLKSDADKQPARTSLALLAIVSALIIGYVAVNAMTEQLKKDYKPAALKAPAVTANIQA